MPDFFLTTVERSPNKLHQFGPILLAVPNSETPLTKERRLLVRLVVRIADRNGIRYHLRASQKSWYRVFRLKRCAAARGTRSVPASGTFQL